MDATVEPVMQHINTIFGRTAVIARAASGQGEAEARLFVADGARVVLADVDTKGGQNLAEELGDRAFFHHLDVTQEAGWAAVVGAALTIVGVVIFNMNPPQPS